MTQPRIVALLVLLVAWPALSTPTQPSWNSSDQQTLASSLEAGDTTSEGAQRILPLLRQLSYLTNNTRALSELDAWRSAQARRFASKYPQIELTGPEQTYGTRLIQLGQTNEAVSVLLEEAELLRAPAVVMLERLYYCQPSTNSSQILRYFERTAKEGSMRSGLVLAQIYVDAGKSDQAIEQLRNNTLDEAEELLAALYRSEGRMDEAVAIYRRQADREVASGHYNLAVALQMRGDLTNAFTHYLRASELKPDARSLVNLGQCYVWGWGVDRDAAKGFALYRRAADEFQDVLAMTVVSRLYGLGVGVARSDAEAERYLKWAKMVDGELVRTVLEEMARGSSVVDLGN